MRAFLVGRRPCRGVPVDYFLLVEEWDALWECYGIRVESGGERTEIPGITASQSGILSLLSKLMPGERDARRGAGCGGGLVAGIACSPAGKKESGEDAGCAFSPDSFYKFQGAFANAARTADRSGHRTSPAASSRPRREANVTPFRPARSASSPMGRDSR